MTAIVTQGDAAALPLPDETVDLIVTSPPYFALRSYTDAGEHYTGQVGDELDPGDYLDALIACTAEWMRVLKPGGSIFVNLGDKYSTARGGDRNTGLNERWGNAAGARTQERSQTRSAQVGAVPKSLLGLPWRYAIRCMDELGLILRSEIIWAKPNPLPESVSDRVGRSHEQLFHFTKQPSYYSALDEIREPYTGERRVDRRAKTPGQGKHEQRAAWDGASQQGRKPRSVWTIATQPLKVPAELGIDHFAAYPVTLVEPIVRGFSPAEVCTACGEGRRPVVASQRTLDGQPVDLGAWKRDGVQEETTGVGNWRYGTERSIVGYACACTPRTSRRGKRGDWREGREVMPEHGSDNFHAPGNAVPRRPGGFGTKVPASDGVWEYHFEDWTPPPARPGVVLDPFGGTGTTALVASALGRVGISNDLSLDYCRLARWRTADPASLAKVRHIRASGLPVTEYVTTDERRRQGAYKPPTAAEAAPRPTPVRPRTAATDQQQIDLLDGEAS